VKTNVGAQMDQVRIANFVDDRQCISAIRLMAKCVAAGAVDSSLHFFKETVDRRTKPLRGWIRQDVASWRFFRNTWFRAQCCQYAQKRPRPPKMRRHLALAVVKLSFGPTINSSDETHFTSRSDQIKLWNQW